MAVNGLPTRRRGPTGPRSLSLLVAAALLPPLLSGCSDDAADPSVEPRENPLVLATTWPLFDVARELAQGAAEVVCALPPGQDVRTWSPNRAELAVLAEADLVLVNGAGLEGWRGRANLPRARVVDTSAPFVDRLIERETGVTHSHGNGEQHAHTGTDPHVWLDPELFGLQIRAVMDGLQRVLPEAERAGVEERGGELLDRVGDLIQRCAALAATEEPRVFVATHPTWAYLARRLDLRVVDVDVGGNPSTGELATAIRKAAGDRELAAVLWEQQPSAALADALGERLGVTSLIVAPDVVRPEGDDPRAPLEILEAGIAALESVVGK